MGEPNPDHVKAFDEFFAGAMGFETGRRAQYSYPYQQAIALDDRLPDLIDVPTGCGKTAAIVLGWIWRRFRHADQELRRATPRRLVYCLPMRTLVEQTVRSARGWIRALRESEAIGSDVPVHVLMGGEAKVDWDLHPEHEAILVGTQDMLLSRALNRGYATSRARWPIQFGLLNVDSLWVFDEVQLMGAGLATTAQLEAFRRFGRNDDHCRTSLWMSATIQRDWLKTVDFSSRVAELTQRGLEKEDHKHREIEKRWNARKPLIKATTCIGAASELTTEILKTHQRCTRTIVVVNTIGRARELFEALEVAGPEQTQKTPKCVLLHSRFRRDDRERQVGMALAEPEAAGTIVVSTQVIEAGVDVSATTLFTEVAPWASLVQRFGRCNRRGDAHDRESSVHWINLPNTETEAARLALPYELGDLRDSAMRLGELDDVGLRSLPDVSLPFEHGHVLRRKDLIDLFDTTPDLAGNDIDIDRFVREVEESDVSVLWRGWPQPNGGEPPPEDELSPRQEELCRAPIGEFRSFAKRKAGQVWRWDFRDKRWRAATAGTIAPGQVFVVHADAGGYEPDRGWSEKSSVRTDPATPRQLDPQADRPPDAMDDEPLSRIHVWQTIAQHGDDLCSELDGILRALPGLGTQAEALRIAARWHDRGKAHFVFQDAIDDGQAIDGKRDDSERRRRPEPWRGCRFVAKAPDRLRNGAEFIAPGFWRRYARNHFRHELASALAVLDPRNPLIPNDLRDLVAYLVAAHHGKVRLSIRSLPGEVRPHEDESNPRQARRFARGIWDGDRLPVTDLGGGVIAPEVDLSLEPMELGLCEQPPFAGQPSWAERMIRLRDTLDPFQLAYLEAILRAADMRASRAAEQRAAMQIRDRQPGAPEETAGA